MHILVTGSRGFIGQHLCRKLDSMGYHVIEADRKLGFDLSNREDIDLLPDVDIVVHLVASQLLPRGTAAWSRRYRTAMR